MFSVKDIFRYDSKSQKIVIKIFLKKIVIKNIEKKGGNSIIKKQTK